MKCAFRMMINGLTTLRNWSLSFVPLCLLLAYLSAPLPASAQKAIPSLSGRVVDQADILSAETEKELAAMLKMHEDSTSNQVAVLTIAFLEGEVLEEYSLRVARAWALGQAGRDNGILLLVAYTDRKMRIEVGYGLEGPMPDIVAKRIIDNDIRPYFRNGDFDAGVLSGVRAIVGTLEGTYTPVATSSSHEDPLFVRIIFGLMFMGMPVFSLYSAVFQDYVTRWIMLVFMMPFFVIGGSVIFSPVVGIVIGIVVFIAFVGFQWHISRSPKWADYRKAMKKARQMKKAVPLEIGGRTVLVGPRSASQRRSSGGGGSSFSGGGGSFGGGGASGGW